MRLASHTSAITIVETIIAISLIGVGVASAVGALTKMNAFASMGRNATGAYTAAMNQIDKIQSYKPFNPMHRDEFGVAEPQIPIELQLTGPGGRVENHIPIYKDPTSGVVVEGTRKTVVEQAFPANYKGSALIMYRAIVTVSYQYLNRNIDFTMVTVRAADE